MLDFIREAPFVRIIIPFILGIVLRIYFSFFSQVLHLLILLTLFCLFGSIILNKIYKTISHEWIFGIVITSSLVLSGIILTSFRLNLMQSEVDKALTGQYIICTVTDIPETKEKTIRCNVNVTYCLSDTNTKTIDNRAIVYFQRSRNSETLKLGSRIAIKTGNGELKGNKNPYEFDYEKFLRMQGIYHQMFVDSSSWKKIGEAHLPPFKNFVICSRIKIIEFFRKIGLCGNELSVALSLTIGYRTDLDSNIKQAFSSTGTMHILAVSGMHVGLIYIILNFALGFCDKFKYGNALKSIAIVILIWAYALLSGLSASVLRATIMFTFISLGTISRRSLNTFNSLAISAFFILLTDPLQITDVGFQLSYMAVIGILTIYPLVNNYLKTGKKLVDPIISLLVLSFAAQVGTFPLSLYYFHQFPNYFLITNLLIVPFSTLIIYFSIFLFLFSGWSSILILLGKIFTILIQILNATVLWFERLPFSTTENICIQPVQVILLYLMISLVTLALALKKMSYLIGFLVAANILTATGLIAYLKESNCKSITFYNAPGHTVIQFKSELRNVWLVDELNPQNNRIINSVLQNTIWRKNDILILDSLKNNLYAEGPLKDFPLTGNHKIIQFLNCTCLLGYDKRYRDFPNIDYIFLRKEDIWKNKDDFSWFTGKNIVFCDKISPVFITEHNDSLNNFLKTKKNFVYFIEKQGALQIDAKANKN